MQSLRKSGSIEKSRKNSDVDTLNLIDFGGYTCENNKYGKHLMITAGKYSSFSDLVYDLIQQLPLNDRPKNWENQKNSGCLVTSGVVGKFHQVFKKMKPIYYGWWFNKL